MKHIKINHTKQAFALLLLVLGFLLQGCNGNTKTEGGQTKVEAPDQTVLQATFMGNLKAIEQHIKAGSDLNEKDQYGSTPLAVAITFGKTDIALALIEGGADLTLTSADGSTPLHTAAFFARTEVVESLLKAGVAIEERNSFGATALESASAPFNAIKPIYDQLAKELGPLGLRLDYERIKTERDVIASMIRNHQ